ncbi:unnamed protein product [Peniophora sp. CBMAI 1063]|nr:unnamed protein product [Peniophora sp. CBMAI 1063]
MSALPVYEPRRNGEIFHVICCIQYCGSKAFTLVESWNPNNFNARNQLRDDLRILKLPLIKAENVQRCQNHGCGLELCWRNQRYATPFHKKLESAFARLSSTPNLIVPAETLSFQLFYLPVKHAALTPSWNPKWTVRTSLFGQARHLSPSFEGESPAASEYEAESMYETSPVPALPITPQSPYMPATGPPSTVTHAPPPTGSNAGWKYTSGWPDYTPSSPSCGWGGGYGIKPAMYTDPRLVTSPYAPATPITRSPVSEARSYTSEAQSLVSEAQSAARESQSPVYSVVLSVASPQSPASTRSRSPISDTSETLASVCLSEFMYDFATGTNYETRRKAFEEATESLFDAEPQHRPSGQNVPFIDMRRAAIKALCARAECATELEVQLQEAIVTRREAEVLHTRDVVAANTRAQELAVVSLEFNRRYDILENEHEQTKTALAELEEENGRLSGQVESLEQDLSKTQAQRATLHAAWKTNKTKVQDLASQLAAAEDKISKQQVALSAATVRSGRLQNDLASAEEERRKEEVVSARERERWRAEKAQMSAELRALRAERARTVVVPALMDALLQINDLLRVGTD